MGDKFNLLNHTKTAISSLTNNTQKELEEKEFGKELIKYAHGTSMTGLFVASQCIVNKDELFNLPEKYGNNRSVMGTSPEARIFGIEGTSVNSLSKIFQENTKLQIYQLEAFNKPRSSSLLINISGGEESSPTLVKKWVNLIKSKCNEDILIIAAARNSVLPAILQDADTCINKKTILIVGAYYYKNNTIKLHDRIDTKQDLVAPGGDISVITPNDRASIGLGSSPATALVTTVAASLLSCKKTPMENIRNAILKYADYNPKINKKVLNIRNTIESFCINKSNKNSYSYVKVVHENNYAEFINV